MQHNVQTRTHHITHSRTQYRHTVSCTREHTTYKRDRGGCVLSLQSVDRRVELRLALPSALLALLRGPQRRAHPHRLRLLCLRRLFNAAAAVCLLGTQRGGGQALGGLLLLPGELDSEGVALVGGEAELRLKCRLLFSQRL